MTNLLLLALAGYTTTLAAMATHSHEAPAATTSAPVVVIANPPPSPVGCHVLPDRRLPERSPPRLVLRCDEPAEIARFVAALGPPTLGECSRHCAWGHDIHMFAHETETERYTTIEMRWPLTLP